MQEELENLDSESGSSSKLSHNKSDSSTTTGRFYIGDSNTSTSTINDKLAKVSLRIPWICELIILLSS